MRVGGVIVCFNPNLEHISQSVRLLEHQLAKIVVVDNGSNNATMLAESLRHNATVTVLALGENFGIAKALNGGIAELDLEGFEWALTLDQDSLVPSDFLEELTRRIPTDAAILCPDIVDVGLGENRPIYEWTSVPDEPVAQMSAITSGSLTSIPCWARVGGFDESMFIDFVDFEFCSRLRAAGLGVYRVPGVSILHELGRSTPRRVLWRMVNVTNHSPMRVQYYMRNGIYLMRKIDKAWWPERMRFRLLARVVKVLFFEEERKKKIVSIVHGLKLGLRAEVSENSQGHSGGSVP